MKGWIRTSLAAALAATVGLGATAAVAGPWGDCDGPRGGKHTMGQRMGPEAMADRATERLAALQAALALKPEQTAAWEQFKGAVQDKSRQSVEHMKTMREQERPVSALERMERMESFGKDRLAAMQDIRKAAEMLYTTLDTAQKNTFDEQFRMFGPGAMGGGMRHHRHAPGREG